MKVVVQRSLSSSVEVSGEVVGKIKNGLVILVGFTYDDSIKEIEWMVDKIIHLRILNDASGVMNCSLIDLGGEILSISQFTLYADSQKGRRPSYQNALPNKQAKILYDLFNLELRKHNINVETGIFGADMKVSITNDGPVTIVLESRKSHVKK